MTYETGRLAITPKENNFNRHLHNHFHAKFREPFPDSQRLHAMMEPRGRHFACEKLRVEAE